MDIILLLIFLSFLFFLGYFFFSFVPLNMIGLLIRLGKPVRVIQKGLHLKIPLIDNVVLYPFSLCKLEVDAPNIETTDSKVLDIKIVLFYKINNPLSVFKAPGEYEINLAQIVLNNTSRNLRSFKSQDLLTNRHPLEIGLANDIKRYK